MRVCWRLSSVLVVLLAASTRPIHLCAAFSSEAPFRIETAVTGESSVVDKETGRIFWESSRQTTLSQNLAPRLRSVTGIPHLKATILSTVLWFELASTLAGLGRGELQQRLLSQGASLSKRHTFLLSFVQTLLLLPRVPRWLLILTALLALFEACFCSTRQYLSHTVTDVEGCIEKLRQAPVVVEWHVRAYHYQRLLGGLCSRKIISNKAAGQYQPEHWEDETVAGVWKRAASSQGDYAPFTKITLSKTLLLRDAKARREYLKQQHAFVQSAFIDEFAEFSTNICIAGFEPRLLAIRKRRRWLYSLPVFWMCTVCGLTVPFRRWFSSHCDEVRVAVVKEVGTTPAKKSKGWFATKNLAEDDVRMRMEAQLYKGYNNMGHNHQNATAALVEEGLEAAYIISKLPEIQSSTNENQNESDKNTDS